MQVEIHQHLSTMYFTVNNFWGGGGDIRVAVVGDEGLEQNLYI